MNPLYNQLNGSNMGQSSNPMSQFMGFMNAFKGQNPSQIINSLLSTGKITQNDYEQAQQRAKQFESQFEGLKQSFGFK